MKIQDGKNVKQAIRPEPQNKIDKKSDDFKNILSEVRSKVQGSQDRNSLSTEEIQKINLTFQNANPVARLEASGFSESPGKYHSGEVKKVEEFFDLLESYIQALSDPKMNLREIATLVKSLEIEKEKLAELGENLPDGDILKEILHHTVIITNVEVLRFNRGDYI